MLLYLYSNNTNVAVQFYFDMDNNNIVLMYFNSNDTVLFNK